jgi:hypothetical protein
MNRYFYVLLILLTAGCGVKTDDGKLLTLNIEKAMDNRQKFDLAEISDGIDFIALDDSRQESLLGDIRLLSESRTGFYVKDDKSSVPVKLFDHTGQFVAARGRIGRGPDEFIFVNYMTVDYETDNLFLYVSDGGSVYMFAYDSGGNLLARTSVELGNRNVTHYEGEIILLKSAPLHQGFFGYVEESTVGTKVPFLNLFSSELQHLKTLYVIDKGSGSRTIFTPPSKQSPIARSTSIADRGVLSNNGKTLMVKEERGDTVFYYSSGALMPAFVLDFGKYTFPAEAFGLNPNASPGNGYLTQKVLEGDKYLFVEALGREDERVQLIFDRRNPSKCFSTIGPDGKLGLNVGGVKFTPMYIRDNRLVGYMQAFDIVDNAAAITNPDLKALAATLKEDSNPVIVVAKLKN